MTNCRYLESRLERLVAGALPPGERETCREHLASCRSCRELVELATLPAAPPPGDTWVREVLARTSGRACAGAREGLPELVDGTLSAVESTELEAHLEGCAACAALASTLRALARELPGMARLRPDDRFVADVLARTLPWTVRWRRARAEMWRRWVHRPRFASEAAYVGVLALVLVFATPGSPLEAVPSRALEAVRSDPGAELAPPVAALGERLDSTVEELRATEAAGTVASWYASSTDTLDRARRMASEVGDRAALSWGTLRAELASLLEKAEEPAPEPQPKNEETP